MKILITGAAGMLGRTLCNSLREHDLIPLDREDGDITDGPGFLATVMKHRPDVIIHCAAMTAVDLCESKQDLAWKLNAIGTANVAVAARMSGARLIAISTDYVFEGDADSPYNEFDEPTGGHCVYGQSKWAAERAVKENTDNFVIARISWLYGHGGPSFVHTMLRLADGSRPQLKVVDDQIGNPTSTIAVANALKVIIDHPEINGVIHLTCEGETSWYGFAKKIFEYSNKVQKVVPCTSEQYPTPAKRPANSRLEKKVLRLRNLPPMPHWEDALREFMATEFPIK